MPEPERDPSILAAKNHRQIPGLRKLEPGELIEDPVLRRKYQASVNKKNRAQARDATPE